MEYYKPAEDVQARILCCKCGIVIEPNPVSMCVACVRTEIDITEGIPKQGTIYFCKGCERYLQPPAQWMRASLESRELLALCLKKLKGLNRVRLVDATFAWTEPHSKRIKLKLTIQKEVMSGAILQQVFIVEFTVNHQMCDDCHRVEAKDFWKALVQVRQKTTHKKTFFYLEQLILKHKVHTNTLNITTTSDGIDFFYSTKDHARKMVDFLSSVVPSRYITSQQLISHDIHSNIFNYKFSFSVEIVPICKDDVVCLPSKLAHSLGGIGQICICSRITSSIYLIDPSSAQIADISAGVYWRDPFVSICGPKQLVEYIIMNVEIISDASRYKFAGQGATSEKHVLADIWVVKASELGKDDAQQHCRTHIGHLLKHGDSVLGFDVANANVNNQHFEKLKPEALPSIVIVKKIYGDKSARKRKRKWKLRHINEDMENMAFTTERDYTDFLEDLEEDPVSRQGVNIFRDKDICVDTDDTDDEDLPRITLQEMLEDLHIDEDATGAEGDSMLE